MGYPLLLTTGRFFIGMVVALYNMLLGRGVNMMKKLKKGGNEL